MPIPVLGFLSAARGVLSNVPWYWWAIAVLLAYGLFNRHQFRSVRTDFEQAKTAAAAERAASQAEAQAEHSRRLIVQKEATDAANLKSQRLQTALAASTDAGRELRDKLAALEARSCSGDPVPAGAGQAASSPADLRAYVSRRLDEAAEGIAGFAERAAIAGQLCVESYQALKPKK